MEQILSYQQTIKGTYIDKFLDLNKENLYRGCETKHQKQFLKEVRALNQASFDLYINRAVYIYNKYILKSEKLGTQTFKSWMNFYSPIQKYNLYIIQPEHIKPEYLELESQNIVNRATIQLEHDLHNFMSNFIDLFGRARIEKAVEKLN